MNSTPLRMDPRYTRRTENSSLYVFFCRYNLCRVKGYDKLSNLQRPAWAERSRPTSPPRYTFPSLPSSSPAATGTRLSPVCRWWRVYAEAHTLQRNWAVGVYTAAPLLRGHKQRVTCIAHEGGTTYLHFAVKTFSHYKFFHARVYTVVHSVPATKFD